MRFWAIPVLLLAGCGAAPSNPRNTVIAYAEALRKNQPTSAYLLFSRAERQHLDPREFARRWQDAAKERASLLVALETAAPAKERALVESPVATRTLERDPATKTWRLLDPLAAPAGGARTVAQAVNELAVALEHPRLDELFRLLSPPLRQAIEQELAERIKGLRTLGAKPIPGDADHLKLRYGPHYILQLRKTGEVWQIDDLN